MSVRTNPGSTSLKGITCPPVRYAEQGRVAARSSRRAAARGAHETACALRDAGDLSGAADQFQRSVRKRKATTFTRTHAVTLGYLGTVQARSGQLEQACATWTTALDVMGGVQSARTRNVARDIRATVAPRLGQPIAGVREINERAAQYLATTGK